MMTKDALLVQSPATEEEESIATLVVSLFATRSETGKLKCNAD